MDMAETVAEMVVAAATADMKKPIAFDIDECVMVKIGLA